MDNRLVSTIDHENHTTSRGYSYNDNGSRKSVVYPDGSREDYTYWNDGLSKTLTNKKADGTVIDNYSYTYDGAHNQKSKTDKKGVTSYTYDSLNRLDSVTEPGETVTGYTYDRAGNRLTETVTDGANVTVTTYSYNEQNRLLNTITQGGGITQKTSYFYDNNGNMLSMVKSSMKPATPGTKATMTLGKVGTIAGDSSSTFYQYDVWNQLVKSVEGSSIDTYAYDGDGLRVQKAVNGVVTGYLYENDKVVLEVDGSGNQTAKNVYGTNLLTRTVNGDTLYYMYNGHADVTALLKTDGTIAGTYYYDAFGNITEQTGNVNNSITYAGYQYDRDTGLYYLNARYYDPTTARFITEDTFRGQANDPLSLNLYTYCHNEPIMYDDPTGHVQGFSYLTGQPTSIPSPTVKTNSAVYYNTGTNKVTTTSTQAKSNTQTQSAVYCNTGTLKLPVVSKPSVVATTAVKSTTNAGKNVTPPSVVSAKPFTPGLDGLMVYTGTSQGMSNSTASKALSLAGTTTFMGNAVGAITVNANDWSGVSQATKTINTLKDIAMPSATEISEAQRLIGKAASLGGQGVKLLSGELVSINAVKTVSTVVKVGKVAGEVSTVITPLTELGNSANVYADLHAGAESLKSTPLKLGVDGLIVADACSFGYIRSTANVIPTVVQLVSGKEPQWTASWINNVDSHVNALYIGETGQKIIMGK